MQEGDVQIKGYPVRLPLDLLLVFTANPEDYTARGKIITPLKDRIGSEIRTHYPAVLEQGIAITEQEAWLDRPSPIEVRVPDYIREVVEQLAFLAREDKRVDKRSRRQRSGCPSRCWRTWSRTRSGARCSARTMSPCRAIMDIYSALPAITGKLELEYEGELKGGDTVARELIRTAVGKVYNEYFEGVNVSQIIKWFDLGGSLKLDETVDSATMVQQLGRHPGPDGEDQGARADRERAGCGARRCRRVHPRRAVRAPPHQPQRRARLRRPRTDRRAANRASGRSRRRQEGKGERPNFRRGSTTEASDEVDQIFPLHRRGSRDRRRRSAEGALRFPAGKRLQHPVHARSASGTSTRWKTSRRPSSRRSRAASSSTTSACRR